MTTKGQTEFGCWINQRYGDYIRNTGTRITWKSFAQTLGVTSMTLDRWIKGQNKPSLLMADALADYFTDDSIYRMLDYPSRKARQLADLTVDLPEAELDVLLAAVKDIRQKLTSKGKQP
jgi:transcriptional regulator with XRE-family HTH domain